MKYNNESINNASGKRDLKPALIKLMVRSAVISVELVSFCKTLRQKFISVTNLSLKMIIHSWSFVIFVTNSVKTLYVYHSLIKKPSLVADYIKLQN